MSKRGRPGAVLYSTGSPVLENLRAALAAAGVEARVVGRREEVFEAAPPAIVVDLHAFPDPWNDIRRFGTDPRLARSLLFVFAEPSNAAAPSERAERFARFARRVAGALGISGSPSGGA